MHKPKKGAIDQLSTIVVSLGTIAILVAIVLLIMSSLKSSPMVCGGNTDNASVGYYPDGGICLRCSANTTTGALTYLNTTDGLCKNVSDGKAVGASLRSEYTGSAYNATAKVMSSTSDVPTWLPIVIITLIGGILLMLVRFFKQS